VALVSAGVVVILTGCGKSGTESGGGQVQAPQGGGSTAGGVQQVVTQAQHMVQTVVTQAQQVVKTVEETAQKAQQVAVQATEQAQAALDKAKALLAEKKVQEAGSVLNGLAGATLSTEQQQLLASLTTEVKTLTADIEKGLADLKRVVTEKNYSEGATLVSKLASYQMSAEQQKVYDGLKAEWTKLAKSQAAEQGTKAINNLLGR
jgi:hypothetical protein